MDVLLEFPGHLVGMALLLGASAFFSGAETALFSLSRQHLRRFRASASRARRAAARLMDDPRRVLLTVLLGNTTVNTAFFVVGVVLIQEVARRHPEAVAAWRLVIGAVVPVLVIVFGEVTPKSLAASMPHRLAPVVAPVLWILERVAAPVRLLVGYGLVLPMTRLVTAGRQPPSRAVTGEELQAMVDLAEREGALTAEEGDMLVEVLALGQRRVREAMTPRVEVVACDINTPMPEVLETFRRTRLTKLLVYQGRMDHVVGLVYAKTAYLHPAGPLARLVRPVCFVPETKTVESLLREFRERGIQFAVVVDEYGGLAGVVTLEDCLELVVGEIEDETDRPSVPAVQRLSETEYRLAGDLSVHGWEEVFGVDLPEAGGRFTTLAGFLTSLAGRLPAPGDRIRWRNLEFVVESVRRRRIERVRVRLCPPETEEDGDGASGAGGAGEIGRESPGTAGDAAGAEGDGRSAEGRSLPEAGGSREGRP